MIDVQMGLFKEDDIPEKNEDIVDIKETDILRQMPKVLDLLLADRTSKKNIIWANDNYKRHGREYDAKSQIKKELITGKFGHLIMPRALKNKKVQRARTKRNAEVFTPLWVVKMQNQEINKDFEQDSLEDYVDRKWLEISCGEAPYITSRYHMETGDLVDLKDRVGFLDMKLARINEEVDDEKRWHELVVRAYQSSYGFEWNGDSLLLARENLLYTYKDYYIFKWKKEPSISKIEEIATIISYNIFQMDGIKRILPLSEEKVVSNQIQMSLFEDAQEVEYTIKRGKPVKVMDWKKNKMENFGG